MKALVTGASGFIGSTLVQELNTLGFDVRALMRMESSHEHLEGLKYERVPGELGDFDSLKRALDGVDYVFHLAGRVSARTRAEFFRANAEGTRNLAQATAEARPGLARFVYVSSIAAAGPAPTQRPRTEADPELPVSAYGESKLEAERELLRYKSVYPISVIRPPVVYGPRDRGVFLIIQAIARNLMLVPIGKGEDRQKHYSTVHVRDLCRGIAQAALASREKVPSGEVFFISGDETATYEAILTTIAELLNREPLRIPVPGALLRAAAAGLSAASLITNKTFPFNLDKLNEILPDYWICSNGKAKDILGFAPEFDLRTGMADAIEWYKTKGWL
jgi:dihydroflavonol-4-reductase